MEIRKIKEVGDSFMAEGEKEGGGLMRGGQWDIPFGERSEGLLR